MYSHTMRLSSSEPYDGYALKLFDFYEHDNKRFAVYSKPFVFLILPHPIPFSFIFSTFYALSGELTPAQKQEYIEAMAAIHNQTPLPTAKAQQVLQHSYDLSISNPELRQGFPYLKIGETCASLRLRFSQRVHRLIIAPL